ncbi:MAG: arylsulfatase [Actinobacteria bacterium]|nr:arylsulfatase [Actinomycetota bacterium]MBV9934690.1 arylsulfatase [Actinomycetota bacterium]
MTTRNEFGGRIGRTWRESEPWWPPEPTPPPGAPNVVLIVLDDVGFAQLGCYGSDIETPAIDALAASGVRLGNFHTTALCSPTRACLLTGRNHHRSGMGRVADLASGFPGYWGIPPRQNGYLSEILRANGYATYAVGKWHLTPDDHTHMGAPRHTWPLARGFDRWYGFHGGETHQFVPALYHDNHSVRPPRELDDGYHLTEDLADRAIEFVGDLRAADADRPFFLYFATGACHSPHQAPASWIARYRGHFDGGWDAWRDRAYARQLAEGVIRPGTELSPRPSWVRPWDDVDPATRQVSARFMECFAGFLSHTDAQLGRVLAFIDQLGERENTMVILVSDNGASAEGGADGSINDIRMVNLDPAGPAELQARIDEIGGPTTHNNYPWGWTMAGNTPFRRWKREVHQGGVADPCIVSWPARLAGTDSAGEVRHQFTHAVDVLPTVLELIGIDAPPSIEDVEQSRIDGTSFAYALADDGADAPARHVTQHFEMLGSRAIYHDGWKAVTYHPVGPLYPDGLDMNASFDDDVWELFHVAEDASECHDLAAEHPDKVAELVALWWDEAERNDVLPLDNRVLWTIVNPKPGKQRDQRSFRYFPGGAMVPQFVAANLRNRSHSIAVEVEIAGDDAEPVEGVLLAMGSVLGGWSLHVLGGCLRYVHNLYGKERYVVEAAEGLTPGRHDLVFSFEKDDSAGGTAELRIDGTSVASAVLPAFTPSAYNGVGIGLTCGYEWGPAVGEGYTAPFPFTGTITKATVEVTGPVVRDPLAELAAILFEQ